MERRELFKVLGATLIAARQGVAQHDHGTAGLVDIQHYTPRFFSNREYGAIEALTEVIIPADDQSPGAHAAGVPFYIDTVLNYADPQTQQFWRHGLAAVDESARAQFGKGFNECGPQEKEHLVAVMALHEKDPSTDEEMFFRSLKELTVEAYALSEIGMSHYLGYRGNTAVREFRGCTHPEHQTT